MNFLHRICIYFKKNKIHSNNKNIVQHVKSLQDKISMIEKTNDFEIFECIYERQIYFLKIDFLEKYIKISVSKHQKSYKKYCEIKNGVLHISFVSTMNLTIIKLIKQIEFDYKKSCLYWNHIVFDK